MNFLSVLYIKHIDVINRVYSKVSVSCDWDSKVFIFKMETEKIGVSLVYHHALHVYNSIFPNHENK